METVKFHFLSFALMNICMRNRSGGKCINNRAVKAKAAMPIAGILAAAALMSGLLFLVGSETAIAQQNMTATNATTTAGNATGMTAAGNQTAGNATGMTAAGNQTAGNATGMTAAGNQTDTGNQTSTGTTGGNNSDPLSDILGGIFGGGG
jgi:hypothetical protein